MPALTADRILVTGGAGFIGCGLSHRLAEQVDRYVAFDVLHPQVHATRSRPSRLHPAAELIVGDVATDADWDRILADVQPTVVVHLAAETGTAQSLLEATRHARVNVVGTTQLTDGLARHGLRPRLIVLSSSRAVYGEGRWARPDGSVFYPGQRDHQQLEAGRWDFDAAEPLPSSVDTTVPNPTSVYGATKLAQEHALSAWAAATAVPLSVLRLQNVYGPGQSLTNSYTGIVSLFSQLARSGQSIPVYEDGDITRDFVYIDDVTSALAATLEPGRSPIRADIGSGRSTTILQLAQTLAEIHGAPAPRINGSYREGDVRHAACTLDAAADGLGWSPAWGLVEGLAALQDWIRGELEMASRAR